MSKEKGRPVRSNGAKEGVAEKESDNASWWAVRFLCLELEVVMYPGVL